MAETLPSQHAPSRKRKQPPKHPDLTHRKKRRIDAQDARVIAAQTKGNAFGNGEMDVDKFVRAREFEINALEDAMNRSKKSLTTRAFQNVPRDMRRRTASHNAKRVPKRLRARAAREMAEDNTPIVNARKRKPTPHMRLRLDTVKRLKSLNKHSGLDKNGAKPAKMNVAPSNQKPKPQTNSPGISRAKKNKLAKTATPEAKFRKRQVNKSWLPTHLFHAKRAHMTPPKQPLWRLAIPLSPTSKSYRPTHRSSVVRGAIAWDMSYMSTISLEGIQERILEVLKSVGVGQDDPARFWNWEATRWMDGCRSWEGWLCIPESSPPKFIAPAKIIWASNGYPNSRNQEALRISELKRARSKRKAIVRIHPSSFLELWKCLLRLAKARKPAVSIEDLRFEIGSIDIIGPASSEALVDILRPSPCKEEGTNTLYYGSELWSSLNTVTNPASLPSNAILNLEISDPRLQPRDRPTNTSENSKSRQQILQVLSDWPPDKHQAALVLFDREKRMLACRHIPSQKAINRRKTLAGLDTAPHPLSTDPRIPLTIMTSHSGDSSRGYWTLLLPWKCVRLVWYCLMHYPLSDGGNPSFGGLDQRRQVYMESGKPWFPGDFPGTNAGMQWEQTERDKRKSDWEKRPKSKRVEWDSLDLGQSPKGEIGLGWACDWERLARNDGIEAEWPPLPSVATSLAISAIRSKIGDTAHGNAPRGLITVKIEMLGRGVPSTCARIYRLPTSNSTCRNKWISMLANNKSKGQNASKIGLGFGATTNAPQHIKQEYLALSILDAEESSRPGGKEYPNVPGEEDLIGFVTTGNFNLSEGKGFGIGSIKLDKALALPQDVTAEQQRRQRHLCIVRAAGHTLGRLARWHFVG